MYFSEFPLRYYELQNKRYLIPDIINRVRFTDNAKNAGSLFIEYPIKDSDSPQKLASILYGSSEYDWVIFLFNDIYDYFEQWPMDNSTLNNYIINKYGSQNIRNLHHYENKEGEIVSASYPTFDRIAVDNYAHEEAVNDKKRSIRLLKPDYLQTVLDEFKELLDVK